MYTVIIADFIILFILTFYNIILAYILYTYVLLFDILQMFTYMIYYQD